MSPNDNPNIAIPVNTKLKTPLKASVILLTSVILSACGSSGSDSYNLNDVFGSSQTVGGASQEELDKALEDKKVAEEKAEAEQKAKEAAEKAAAEQKAKAEAAEQAAAEQKANAEAAQKEAADAKAELAKVQAELEKAKKDLEDALASGSGNTEYFEEQVKRRENELKAAQAAVETAEQKAVNAKQSAEAQAQAAQDALQVAKDAAAAAEIQNTPESAKSGVQILNVDVIPLSKVFNTTTRDFDADSTSVVARADLASIDPAKPDEPGLLGQVPVTISGDNDTDVAGTEGFKAHEDSAVVGALGQELPLTYTSTYKDFDDDMRIGHIDGKAVFSGVELPVNGVAVIGNATQAANVPTEGTVGYTGDATHRKLGIGNAIEFGSSVFTADFVAKSLSGNLSFANAGDIALTAGINGNQFSGSKDGYNTEGGFYGGDAQYLGGVYEGNDAQGTYGAKSDAQTAAEKAATDAQAQAKAAQQALAAEQAKADEVKAAAEQAKADAAEAQEALDAAKSALENAENGDGGLADAQARAEAAEQAQAKAEEAEKAALKAADAAEAAKVAAQNALEAEKEAAELAIGDAKTEADKLVAEAEDKTNAANEAAEQAKADAKQAKADKVAAEKEAEEAGRLATEAEEKAAAAEKLVTEAEEKAAAAVQAEEEAKKRIEELEAKLYPAEENKSGVQHLSIDGTALGAADPLIVTTRDFTIRSSSDADARADVPLEGVVDTPIAVTLSGDSNSDTSNGFKSHEGTGAVLAQDDLTYTSIYKDFGDQDELRIAHVDGTVSALDSSIPVDGVLVVGNKTATLPTEGTANYAGDATNRKVGVDGQIEYGSSEFTANFVNKSLDGKLKFKQAGEIGLSAAIEGNEFSGAADATNGYATEGAFYGAGAKYVGGIYEGNGLQGTYGATKDGTPAELVEPTPEPPANPGVAVESEITGFQSNTLSSKKGDFTDDAIGYAEIRNDKSDYTDTQEIDGAVVPIDNGQGDNFTSYDKVTVRADMTKPDSVKEKVEINISGDSDTDYGNGFKLHTESTKVQGPVALDLNYSSVYKNFDSQMQIGHIYGDPNQSFLGDLARVSTVFVQGNATNLEDMKYMKELAQYNIDNNINDGTVSYAGVATYMENLHLKDGVRSGPIVDGTSQFDVDFINDSIKGELTFEGDLKYNPTGKVAINADITGNTFAGNVDGIDTAGGFYGEDAQFLGGIYQQAIERGGKGAQPGEGTTFQGTFGAEKQ